MAKLHLRVSAMNAGKSTYLLQVAHNYVESGGSVSLFTSKLDDRYGVGVISSRIGISGKASVFDDSTDFALTLDPHVSCNLIDESQFLSPQQVKAIHRWVHTHNVPVMCFGLRSDFRGEPFPGSAYLLALADSIEEIRTVCSCGKKATMNMRIDDAGVKVSFGDQVLVGGNSRYRSVCGRCFYQADSVAQAVGARNDRAAPIFETPKEALLCPV